MNLPVSATSKELYKPFVSKELQLLSNLVMNMIIVRML